MQAHILCSVTIFSETRAFYEIMSEHLMEPESLQTIWHLRVAYWLSKPTRVQTHARACSPTHTHTHTTTHAHIRMPSPTRARPRAHTQKYVILIAFHCNSSCVYACHAHCLSFSRATKPSDILFLVSSATSSSLWCSESYNIMSSCCITEVRNVSPVCAQLNTFAVFCYICIWQTRHTLRIALF
jgi:hypothetical protein